MREVCEPEESQDQHDNEREHNKPLPGTYSISKGAEETVSVSPVVAGLACRISVSGSGGSALQPLWPCAKDVVHSCTSDQQTNLP